MNFLHQNRTILETDLVGRSHLSDTGITKMVSTSTIEQIFNADGCESNNSTKAVLCITSDLFGDWREERAMRMSDNKKLRVWCTAAPTQYRLTPLMYDPQYRMQDCSQQSADNQPPHAGFYLGSDQPLPERPNVKVLGADSQPTSTEPPTEPATETRPWQSRKTRRISSTAMRTLTAWWI